MRPYSSVRRAAAIVSCLRILSLPLIAVITGCATSNIPSLTAADARFGQSQEEKNLLTRAGELDQELDRKGMLLETPALVEYLQNVGQPLVPKEAAQQVGFRFHVLRSPVSNAFALPNGSIYLSVGLLAYLDDEAELAQVMWHGGARGGGRRGGGAGGAGRAGGGAARGADM